MKCQRKDIDGKICYRVEHELPLKEPKCYWHGKQVCDYCFWDLNCDRERENNRELSKASTKDKCMMCKSPIVVYSGRRTLLCKNCIKKYSLLPEIRRGVYNIKNDK